MPYSWSQARRTPWICLHPVQFHRVRMQEASEAKEKMNGRMACGRPLVVRLASEKSQPENKAKMVCSSHSTTALSGSNSGQTSRSAKITAIKNKLRRLDQEDSHGKKQKKDQNT